MTRRRFAIVAAAVGFVGVAVLPDGGARLVAAIVAGVAWSYLAIVWTA